MNWRSPLELAIRLINWTWALDLIRESRAWAGAPHQRIRHATYLHLWEITRKYSKGSSSNNHLIGEAAGVFVATAYHPDLPGSSAWHEVSRDILSQQLFEQTHVDGGTREQATGYHLFILQFFLIAGVVARRLQRDFSPEYWDRVEQMFAFMAALMEAGPLPMIGDADDGFVLGLGTRGPDPHGMLAVGADIFGRDDFSAANLRPEQWAYWCLGPSTLPTVGSRPRQAALLESRAFPETGYYLLQAGHAGSADAVSLLMDCAELGFGALAAHGHADALSITLRLAGQDVLVDPGTYDYFTFPDWRRYYRSTPAHNTVCIDGEDQSLISGPFMWASKARARCLSWSPSAGGGLVQGEHDGYTRLSDPVIHRRSAELNHRSRLIVITDDIVATGAHEVAMHLHFAEGCAVRLEDRVVYVEAGSTRLRVTLSAPLSVSLVSSADSAGPGWVSRGYHVRTSAPAVVARAEVTGSVKFETRFAY